MTRPKVESDKRQRTAQACDSCKRRKQKCDGQQPCATCAKRVFDCTYSTTDHDSHFESSDLSRSKRTRQSYNSSQGDAHSTGTSFSGSNQHLTAADQPKQFAAPSKDMPSLTDDVKSTPNLGYQAMSEYRSNGNNTQYRSDTMTPNVYLKPADSVDEDEEAENHTMTRMLEDRTGRLLYLGDAANLSFLQLLRMIIETAAGPSPFTLDPERHLITETTLDRNLDQHLTYRLPDKESALVLVDSFFVNTHGLIEVFDERAFLEAVHKCYADPMMVDRPWLCHFFLVLAIGLTLAAPLPGTQEASVVMKLRMQQPKLCEIFFLNARSLNDPVYGMEDSDFWSVQALTLMAVYMLTHSIRNGAFAYVGMAIRSAYSLGMHREETLVLFSPADQAARRKMWRSLFILDRFLAASLGRPMAITEEESLSDMLTPSNPASIGLNGSLHLDQKQMCTAGMEAVVRSSHVVGIILKKVYQKRKISTQEAQELADQCIEWPQSLSPALHWRQASPKNIRQAIAILHANLLYCQSIILLTRPFFLYLLSAEVQRTRLPQPSHDQTSLPGMRKSGKIRKFSDACLIASNHSIALVQNAYQDGYLPQQNPFSNYALYAAALIIFANEFTHPGTNGPAALAMSNSIHILEYCGSSDAQAKQAALVLRQFRDVLQSQTRGNDPSPGYFQMQKPDLSAYEPSFTTPLPNNLPHMTGAPALSSDPDVAATATTTTTNNSNATAPLYAPQPHSLRTAPNPLPVPTFQQEESFSGLLDLDNTVLPTGSDREVNSADEAIDFDALWHWPTGTTPLPTPGG